MKAPGRFSIGFLMVVVLLVAVDFGIVRGLCRSGGHAAAIGIVVVPMANLLILSGPKLRMANPTRSFWIGFEVAGWLATLAIGFLA